MADAATATREACTSLLIVWGLIFCLQLFKGFVGAPGGLRVSSPRDHGAVLEGPWGSSQTQVPGPLGEVQSAGGLAQGGPWHSEKVAPIQAMKVPPFFGAPGAHQ